MKTKMTFLAEGEVEQVALGKKLSTVVANKALIFLEGDLGAGKTTLVRGFIQSRGHKGNVKSPTYTLIEPYELASGHCYHLDLYRLSDAEELEFLGVREMLDEESIILIEWPQRGENWLPEPDLLIELNYIAEGAEAREILIRAQTSVGEAILQQLIV